MASPASKSSDSSPFKAIDGLQVYWGDDSKELELIPMWVLEHPPAKAARAFTAALARSPGFPRTYSYPVTLDASDREVSLEYSEAPHTWRPEYKDELIKGRLTVRFQPGSRRPEAVLWHQKGGVREPLEEGTYWKFEPPVQVDEPGRLKRAKLPAMVVQRPGQALLREILLETRRKCEVSETTIRAVLDACHIVEVGDNGDDHPRNAFLLRKDVHALFDSGLLQFVKRPDGQWQVELDEEVRCDPAYEGLHEKLMPNLDRHAAHLRRRAELKQQRRSPVRRA